MTHVASKVFLAAITALVAVQLSCSPAPSPSASPLAATSTLTQAQAASLAARLANDRCESQYHARPFSPEEYTAVLQEGTYRWGGLDVGGPSGFSALVTFGNKGSEPHVEVYFSSDALRPQRLPIAPIPRDVPILK